MAVLAVILFHLDENWLPGGFVGVDIFFVISGYLISLHIISEIERGSFSLLDFYRRRVKRIAPAMLLVVGVVFLVSQSLLLPEDAEAVARSAFWSLLSLANVHFWLGFDASYFAAAVNEKPLLHLWSLGVEEQFYLFWPVLLVFLLPRVSARAFVTGLALAAISSFLLAEIVFGIDPGFSYYMLPTRLGELLVGALLAYAVVRRADRRVPEGVVRASGPVGVTLVFGSLVLLSSDDVFPGVLAIPAAVGTALIILAGSRGMTRTGRVLGVRPLVWIGLVSYSAYLWHWPLIALYRYGHGEVTAPAAAFLFLLTFLLAYMSYRFVELPARGSRRQALPLFATQYVFPASVLCVLAVISLKSDGYALRSDSAQYKETLAAVRHELRPAYHADYVCQEQRLSIARIQSPECVVGADVEVQPHAILWGDSNAAHYVGVIGAIARAGGWRFKNLQVGHCPPVIEDELEFVPVNRREDCRVSNERIWEDIEAFDTVLMGASWSSYMLRSDRFLEATFETARSLVSGGKSAIILGKVATLPGYDRLCREKAIAYPFMKCHVSSARLDGAVALANRRLREFAMETEGVTYFDVNDYLCSGGECNPFDSEGRSLYYDEHHLNIAGSWEVGRMVVENEGIPGELHSPGRSQGMQGPMGSSRFSASTF